ncbi:MAG TPA: hypothetical protein VFJ85_05015 [Acidimicrobiales bacterium]|nr:hypothetical protein [Acidimicrobiales bacterium]
MTPARRRQASPKKAEPAPAADGTEDAPTGDAGGDAAPPAEAAPADTEDRVAVPSPSRSRTLHPERIWPD